jgi:hypothetical protein
MVFFIREVRRSLCGTATTSKNPFVQKCKWACSIHDPSRPNRIHREPAGEDLRRRSRALLSRRAALSLDPRA